jgi:hypothetical protein
VANRSDALADDLRALATDLKSLVDTATTDPKERRRKELRWRILYTALAVVMTQAARRAAVKMWPILTGEQPPTKRAPQHASHETERVHQQSGAHEPAESASAEPRPAA